MAQTNYAKLQKTANKLINGFGNSLSVVISHTEEGAYDPNTGLIPSTTTTQTGICVLLDYGSKELDGTLIVLGDKKLLLSPIASDGTELVKPEINDTALISGITYTIKTPLTEIKPNGVDAVLFKLNLRN